MFQQESLEQIVARLISQKQEGDFWDFKQEWHEDDKKADLLMQSKYRIHPFGYNEQIYTYDELVNPELESLSKRINFAYSGLPRICGRFLFRSA